MSTETVTLIEDAIHNPAEPRHFMTITPVKRAAAASIGDTRIAHSDEAVVVKEVARQIYDPTIYFPRSGVDMNMLERIERSTHCPLKGDTEYFDIVTPAGRAEAAAWSYVSMSLGDELKELIAFDPSQVTIA